MIREITLMVDRWLNHSTYGVAQMLPNVPKEAGDVLPAMPPIYNDVEDDSVAMEINPVKVPALVVWTERNPDIEFQGRRPGFNAAASVVIGYVTRDESVIKARRDGSFILRAVRQCLALMDLGKISEDARTLNGIKIVDVVSIDEERVTGSIGGSTLVGLVVMNVKVMDTVPLQVSPV